MSTARTVPETYELDGDDARDTLASVSVGRLVKEGFTRFRTDELVSLLLDAGGDAVPFLDHLELAEHPQIKALGLLVDVVRSDGSVGRDVAPAWRLSETPASIRRGAPFVGEHTDEVLSEAGYDPGGIDALRRAGIIG